MPRKRIVDDSSDEEASDSPAQMPSDKDLEKALRKTAANIFQTGQLEQLTVKRVRLATESALGLDEGFFKGDQSWKLRSEKIIKDEAEKQEAGEKEKEQSPEPSVQSPVKSKPKKKAIGKRISDEKTSVPKKRRKTSSDVESQETPIESAAEDEEPSEIAPKPASNEDVREDQSESEMSVLIDEEPKKPRQKKASSTSKQQNSKKAVSSKTATDSDPDQAEIKRLQGWLIKCGIRKMWARELAPYHTPKAKIKHLKKMLEDAGMRGRYSIDKARQIREERELQADLEAVKEGASRWGAEGAGGAQDGSESEAEKPRRRLMKGRQSLAFLSDDGEETD